MFASVLGLEGYGSDQEDNVLKSSLNSHNSRVEEPSKEDFSHAIGQSEHSKVHTNENYEGFNHGNQDEDGASYFAAYGDTTTYSDNVPEDDQALNHENDRKDSIIPQRSPNVDQSTKQQEIEVKIHNTNDIDQGAFGAYAERYENSIGEGYESDNSNFQKLSSHAMNSFPHHLGISSMSYDEENQVNSYEDVVERLGIDTAWDLGFGDFLYDSDDEALAKEQQEFQDKSTHIVDTMEGLYYQIEEESRMHQDAESESSSVSNTSKTNRKRTWDVVESSESMAEYTSDNVKRQRMEAPPLPESFFSSHTAGLISNNKEETENNNELANQYRSDRNADPNVNEDESEENYSDFDLDEESYPTFTQEVEVTSDAVEVVTQFESDPSRMNIPDHIRHELSKHNITEISGQEHRDEIAYHRLANLSKPNRDTEREIEKAKQYLQLTAGNLMGHEMVKLAQKSLQLSGGGKPSDRKR